MTPALVACSACQKHVRDDETRCPFCGAARTPGLSPMPVPAIDRNEMHVVPAYGGPFRARERRSSAMMALGVMLVLGVGLGVAAYLLR